MSPRPGPKSVLTVSLAKYLHGYDISETIEKDWGSKATPQQRAAFNNQGFNLDPLDPEGTMEALKIRLEGEEWDGVIMGWCIRGNRDFTPLFEQVVELVGDHITRTTAHRVEKGDKALKLMFSNGPDDLMNTTMRTFGNDI